jgi:hypothetical protein
MRRTFKRGTIETVWQDEGFISEIGPEIEGDDRVTRMTGGCQCGAVRYELGAAPKSTVCHCRMCQKAVGNVFAALAMVKKTELTWMSGEPSFYASSNVATRGFCAACGTPLTFAFNDRDTIEVTTGSLDEPAAFPMTEHFGVESRLSWVTLGEGLPEHRTDESPNSPANASGFVSNQRRNDE